MRSNCLPPKHYGAERSKDFARNHSPSSLELGRGRGPPNKNPTAGRGKMLINRRFSEEKPPYRALKNNRRKKFTGTAGVLLPLLSWSDKMQSMPAPGGP